MRVALKVLITSRYQQKFDLEGESGIVVRGIGTAVTLAKEDPIAVAMSHKDLTNKE